MLIAQAHIIYYNDLSEEDESILIELDGDSFVEILKGDFNQPKAIGRVWSAFGMTKGDYSEGDKILVDPEYIPVELFKQIGFEFSGQTIDIDCDYQVWWHPSAIAPLAKQGQQTDILRANR